MNLRFITSYTMRIVEMLGSNMELTEAIKQYVEERLVPVAKICGQFEPCEVRVDVGKTTNHHKNGLVFKAEMNLTIPGKMFRADVKAEDLYAAIDEATDDLRRQMKKHKEKVQDAKKRGGRDLMSEIDDEEQF